MKKFLCILLIVVLVCLAVCCFTACNAKTDETAIIILPGLLASGLYDGETGEPIWDPLTSNEIFMDMFVNGEVYDMFVKFVKENNLEVMYDNIHNWDIFIWCDATIWF